eukprot:scaffold1723_cov104-Isochrysis_galbana.AAC.7
MRDVGRCRATRRRAGAPSSSVLTHRRVVGRQTAPDGDRNMSGLGHVRHILLVEREDDAIRHQIGGEAGGLVRGVALGGLARADVGSVAAPHRWHQCLDRSYHGSLRGLLNGRVRVAQPALHLQERHLARNGLSQLRHEARPRLCRSTGCAGTHARRRWGTRVLAAAGQASARDVLLLMLRVRRDVREGDPCRQCRAWGASAPPRRST